MFTYIILVGSFSIRGVHGLLGGGGIILARLIKKSVGVCYRWKDYIVLLACVRHKVDVIIVNSQQAAGRRT